MTELLVPGLIAAGAITFTYLFCIRPMRREGHCGMPGMSKGNACGTHAEDAEIQRLRDEVADLRTALMDQDAPGRSPQAR